MPLPHYGIQAHAAWNNFEPIYQSQFECIFNSKLLNKKDSDYLGESIIGIKEDIITFNVNSHKVTKSLLTMKDFDLTLKSLEKDGTVKGIYEFYECSFINLKKEIMNYDYESDDILRYAIQFKYENMEFYAEEDYKNYIRLQKFKNILN